MKSGSPGEGKPKVYTFRLSDGEADRYGDRLNVRGWKLDAFNANPVIFYNHESGVHFGDDLKSLPIGSGRAYIENNQLMLDVTFDQGDAFAKEVERKVEGGYLRAVSVGFLYGDDCKPNDTGGVDVAAPELLEASIVTIPGKATALRVRALEDDSFVEALAAAVARKLAPSPTPAPHKLTASDVEAITAGVRQLLAGKE